MIYQGHRRATMTFSKDYINDDFHDILFGATTAAFDSWSIRMQSDEYITGTTPYSLEIWFPAGIVLSSPVEYGGGPDVIPETITVEAAYGGSGAIICNAILVNGTDNTTVSGSAYGGSGT